MEDIDLCFQSLVYLSDSLIARNDVLGSVKCLEGILQSRDMRFLPEMIAVAEYKLANILLALGVKSKVEYAKRLTDNAVQYFTGKNVVVLEKDIVLLLFEQRLLELYMLNSYSLVPDCIEDGLDYAKANNFIYWEGFFLVHLCSAPPTSAYIDKNLKKNTERMELFIRKCYNLGDMIPSGFLLACLIAKAEMIVGHGGHLNEDDIQEMEKIAVILSECSSSGWNDELVEDEYLREYSEKLAQKDIRILKTRFILLKVSNSILGDPLENMGRYIAELSELVSDSPPTMLDDPEDEESVFDTNMDLLEVHFTLSYKYFCAIYEKNQCNFKKCVRIAKDSLRIAEVTEAELNGDDLKIRKSVNLVSFASLLRKMKIYCLDVLFNAVLSTNPSAAAGYLKKMDKIVIGAYPYLEKELWWQEASPNQVYDESSAMYEEYSHMLRDAHAKRYFFLLEFNRILYLHALGLFQSCTARTDRLLRFLEEGNAKCPQLPWLMLIVHFVRVALLSSSKSHHSSTQLENAINEGLKYTEEIKLNPYADALRAILQSYYYKLVDSNPEKAIIELRTAIDVARNRMGNLNVVAISLIEASDIAADTYIEKSMAGVALSIGCHINDLYIKKSTSEMLSSLLFEVGDEFGMNSMKKLRDTYAADFNKSIEEAERIKLQFT